MTEMVPSGLMRGRWRRSDGPLEGDTRPKWGETAGPRTPWTPPRQCPTPLVVGFEHREEAEQFLTELRERFAKFGLTLHPDKTRLIEFGRFAAASRRGRGDGRPESFDFLGFTHSCGKTRRGKFTALRQTGGTRREAELKAGHG